MRNINQSHQEMRFALRQEDLAVLQVEGCLQIIVGIRQRPRQEGGT
jgi:hypothetical protein